MRIIYPVYKPFFGGNEKLYLNQCIDTGWLTENGEFVGRFENDFSAFVASKWATGCANGTVALHLAVYSLGLGPGDEVIMPSITYVATANVVKLVGATPVFADIDPLTWQIDVDQVESLITKKTKAIIPVHLYGAPAPVDQLQDLAEKYHLFLIEDAAEAFGTFLNQKHVGTFGHLGMFSFYGNKTITCGEGGMLVGNNKALEEKVIFYKGHCMSPNKQFWHTDVGFNYRMTNTAAAIGLAQLEQAKGFLDKKKQINLWYKNGLADCPVQFQQLLPKADSSYWMVNILLKKPGLRDQLATQLKAKGVETRPMFYPLHQMPMFKTGEKRIHSENISYRGLTLPSYPVLSEENVAEICSYIKEFLA